MKNHNRDLLVLFKNDVTDQSLEQAVEGLHNILRQVESNDVFCKAHELVARTKITRKPKAIIKAISLQQLKPFYFLINKN